LTGQVDFGVALPTFCGGAWTGEPLNIEKLTQFTRSAEKLGYTSLWHLDRLTAARPSYTSTMFEPLVTLASLVSASGRMKLGTSVLVAPFRNPAILAKQVSTIDVISGGRFQLGVGTGWDPDEFELTGINKKERGARFEETIQILKLLWTEEYASYEGRYWKFRKMQLEPKPIQSPHPPILMGAGASSYSDSEKLQRVLSRVAKLGDGWFAVSGSSPEAIRYSIKQLKLLLREEKRDPTSFPFIHHKYAYLMKDDDDILARRKIAEVFGRPYGELEQVHLFCGATEMERRIKGFVEAGLSQFNIIPISEENGVMEFVAKEIMPKYL